MDQSTLNLAVFLSIGALFLLSCWVAYLTLSRPKRTEIPTNGRLEAWLREFEAERKALIEEWEDVYDKLKRREAREAGARFRERRGPGRPRIEDQGQGEPQEPPGFQVSDADRRRAVQARFLARFSGGRVPLAPPEAVNGNG